MTLQDQDSGYSVAGHMVAGDGTEPQPDPHYLELLRGSTLPQAYLPPAMTGPHKRWVRVSATVVISAFVGATAYGTCLTYGLGHSF